MASFVHFLRSSKIAPIVAVGLCAVLAACGGGASSGVEGKYFLQMGSGPGEGLTMELRGGGVVHTSLPGLGEEDGRYTVEGDRVTVVMGKQDQVMVYTVVDGDLTGMLANEKVVLEKQ